MNSLSMNSCKGVVRAMVFIAASLIGESAHAADIEPAKVQMMDKFGVNLASGQITHTLNTLSIGGAMGLSHNVSVSANEFNFVGYRGFQDKFYAKSRFVELNSIDPATRLARFFESTISRAAPTSRSM